MGHAAGAAPAPQAAGSVEAAGDRDVGTRKVPGVPDEEAASQDGLPLPLSNEQEAFLLSASDWLLRVDKI